MIRDNIKYCDTYIGLNDTFAKVFNALKELNSGTPAGRIDIDENAWINVNDVQKEQGEDFLFEDHKKYLDIHYVIKGEEQFAYSVIDSLDSEKEYNDADDYELLKGEGEVISLKEGDFCIVYPQDAHAPFVGKSDVLKKAVAKVKIK